MAGCNTLLGWSDTRCNSSLVERSLLDPSSTMAHELPVSAMDYQMPALAQYAH